MVEPFVGNFNHIKNWYIPLFKTNLQEEIMKSLKVLSLFDGISCGMVALERAGIPVKRYVAYEIDQYATQISKKNYPDIRHHGDVFKGDFTKYKGCDLLIGGSPCTYWSIAKQGREITPDGIGGQLFMQYVRALHESGAKYFLYENNYSIHKDIKAFISEQLGVQPIMINSALVSAQQRKRCYWTNIPNVTQPKDKGILLKDILEGAVGWQDKSYCMTSSYNGAVLWNILERGQRTMVAEPVPSVDTDVPVNPMPDGKSRTLKAQYSHTSIANFVRDDNLAASGAATPIRIGNIGKTTGQANRVYSVRGKSVCLQSQAGGSGAKTGLYKIDLPDGDYIIRKPTPVEAERLQTLPDNYTEGISNSQRYKCIGNGWTVDVIAHILSFLKEDLCTISKV